VAWLILALLPELLTLPLAAWLILALAAWLPELLSTGRLLLLFQRLLLFPRLLRYSA
jgi:hypothetical protein